MLNQQTTRVASLLCGAYPFPGAADLGKSEATEDGVDGGTRHACLSLSLWTCSLWQHAFRPPLAYRRKRRDALRERNHLLPSQRDW